MFLRLATGCFLSIFPQSYITFGAFQVLTAVLLRNHCFWMWVCVDKWAVTDVSDGCSDPFSRVKMERNKRINIKHKMELSLFYVTTPTSNLLPILRPAYGRSAEWATLIQWVSRQEVATSVVTKMTTPKLSMENSKSESPPPLTLSLSHLWAPHADLSHLSCSQASPSFWMHNLHLCVGNWPAHRFVFDGSFDHVRDWWSLCHSKTYSEMQNSVVYTVLDWWEQLWSPHYR